MDRTRARFFQSQVENMQKKKKGHRYIDIVNILKVTLNKCKESGLTMVATICDQGKINEAAINYLV